MNHHWPVASSYHRNTTPDSSPVCRQSRWQFLFCFASSVSACCHRAKCIPVSFYSSSDAPKSGDQEIPRYLENTITQIQSNSDNDIVSERDGQLSGGKTAICRLKVRFSNLAILFVHPNNRLLAITVLDFATATRKGNRQSDTLNPVLQR